MTTARASYATAALTLYITAIVLSNYAITHWGTPAGPVTRLTPVGFGLTAPSGVWFAGLSFPARDVVQRTAGRTAGVAAILIAAGVSFEISSPVIAAASALTYLCSETADMLIYTPLQRRWLIPAVIASGAVAAVTDSVLFLHLAHLPAGWAAVAGLTLGKFWTVLAAGPVVWLLRRKGPVAQPHPA